MAGKHRVPMRSAKKYISKLKIIGAAPHVGLSPWAHHDFAQDPVIGTCYNIGPVFCAAGDIDLHFMAGVALTLMALMALGWLW